MQEATLQVVTALKGAFADIDFGPTPLIDRGSGVSGVEQIFVRVQPDRLLEVMGFLFADGRCAFEQLCDLTCVDYLNFPRASDRYGVIYSLLSLSRNHRLWVKCFVNDPDPEVPSVTGIWKGADWLERELWDMFGIRFTGHPDLRRILTWEGFEAHPLRKDYPLRGRGEREDFDVVTRESRQAPETLLRYVGWAQSGSYGVGGVVRGEEQRRSQVVPVVCAFFGMVIRIYHSDHPPPHFHVQYGEWNAVVEIRNGKVLHGRLPQRLARHLELWRKLRIKELNRAWELALKQKPLKRIKPLE